MKLGGKLTGFEVHRPRLELPQRELLLWLAQAYAQAEAVRRALPPGEERASLLASLRRVVDRFACDPSRIARRGISVADVAHTDFEKMEVYRILPPSGDSGAYLEGPAGTGMHRRTRYFASEALSALQELYPSPSKAPEHLIHVSCTGYSAPSAAQRLADLRGWHGRTDITHAYHMGCYAAFPAIRIAASLLSLGQAGIDIAHTEICSLHLNPLDTSAEQIVINSLFGDGFVKYRVVPTAHPEAGLELLALREHLVPATGEQMTWSTADWGHRMTLSREVPERIAGDLAELVSALSRIAGHAGIERDPSTLFAVHPGGPRIIEATQRLLELQPDQVRHSREVLHAHGNMSSATLPHIWRAILKDPAVPAGTSVVSLAFGPGLTIFGALLRKSA